MSKRFLFAGIGVALAAIPFAASAASLSDLQAELASLIAQIEALQGASTSVSVSGNAVSSADAAAVCPAFVHSLTVGSTGSDVTALQQFLQQQGYLNVSATGYFGALTKAALGRWQVSNGIVTSNGIGYGVFGPMSRSFYARFCEQNGHGNQNGNGGNGSTASQFFSADPQSGAAPLTVTFTTNDSINASTTSYMVNFGDGASASMTKGSCVAITAVVGGQGGIRCTYTVSHSYASNGTYTAQLVKQAPAACANPEQFCALVSSMQTVAMRTITVGSSTTNALSFTASPQSGGSPLTVQFTVTAPQGTTLGNLVNFGDGSTSTLLVVPTCSSCNEMGTASHTYTSAGTYTATLTNNMCSCPANGICNCPNIPILGTATVTVTATSTTPSIVQLNAPGTATLGVNDIAEVRNENYYFTLDNLTSSSATIQLTQVGCWNSFPSDTPPAIRCMIAVVPIPPVTLSLNQSYSQGSYGIRLTNIANNEATFSVTAPATTAPIVSTTY